MVLGCQAKDPHFNILLQKLNAVVRVCLKSEYEFIMSIEKSLYIGDYLS